VPSPLIKLYHATSRLAAHAIVADGFRETVDRLTRRSGVWFADRWVEYGTHCDAAVAIEIPEADLALYDLGVARVDLCDDGKHWTPAPAEDFHVFLMPADVANRYPRQLVDAPTNPARGWRRASGPGLNVKRD
jgi:hypothetical protein